MRIYTRTGRNTGVSVGPLGLLLLSPFLAIYYLTVWPFVAVARALARSAERKRKQQQRYR